MENKKVVCVVVLLLLSAGIATVYLSTNSPFADVSGTTAQLDPEPDNSPVPSLSHETTVPLLQNASTDAGLYSTLRPYSPKLHSTHHFLRIGSEVDIEPAHPDAMTKWLRTQLQPDFSANGTESTHSTWTVKQYYDIARSLSLANASSVEEAEIMKDVLSFRAETGGFCQSTNTEGVCENSNTSVLATYHGIMALDTVGVIDDASLNSTIAWLESRWHAQDSFSEGSDDFGRLEHIADSLEVLGIEIESLHDYEEKRESLVSFRDSYANTTTETVATSLIKLRSYTHTIASFGLVNDEYTKKVGEYTRTHRLEGGGFNAFGYNYTDAKSTAVVLNINDLVGRELEVPIDKLEEMYRYHELSAGGFAPTVRTSPSISGTYHARSTLSLLKGGEVPELEAKATELLKRVGTPEKPSSVQDAYYASQILQTTNGTSPSDYTALVQSSLKQQPSLKRLYYSMKLENMTSVTLNDDEIHRYVRSTLNSDGGYGEPSSTEDTYYAIGILIQLEVTPTDPRATISWLRQTREATERGYRYKNGESIAEDSDIYATYLSVKTLQRLGAEPIAPTSLEGWIASHEHPDGGFSLGTRNKMNAGASLSSTYWAVKAISLVT